MQGFAEGLVQKPTWTLAAIHRCITEDIDLPIGEGLAIERGEAEALGATADFRVGLEAFLAKRLPAIRAII